MKCSKLSLIRPINSVMVGIGIIVGEVIAYSGIPPLRHIILGFLVGFLASAGIMALNDYYDVEIDKINAPRRPIPCGAIEPKNAMLLGISLVLLSILVAFLQSPLAGIFASITLFLDVLYDRRLKRSGFPGNLIVSYSVAAPFIYGALALSRSVSDLIIAISLMAFLSNLGREIAKGILDVEGDRLAGAKTIAVTLGVRAARILSFILVLSAVIVSIILPLIEALNVIYYLVIPTTDVMLIHASLIVLLSDEERIRKAKDEMRLAMLIAMVIFILMALINAPAYKLEINHKYLFSSSGIFSS